MRTKNLKTIVLLLGLMLPAAWCGANGTCSSDGYSHIHILDLPFQYANQHSNMFNERPVNWKVIPNKYKLGENKWYTFCHILQVKFGRYITTQHPIAY